VNSAVSLRLDKVIDPASVDDDSLRLICGGVAIGGAVALFDDTLVLTPDSPLPASTSCTVEPASTVRYANAETVEAQGWAFSTGTTERTERRFTGTRTLFDDYAIVLGTMYRDGRLVVARREGSTLIISVSTDEGETFRDSRIDVFAEPSDGVVDELDMAYRDGVLHLAWRVVSNTQADIFYARSTSPELTAFSTATTVTRPYDTLAAFAPSVEADPDGRVHLAWDEFCNNGACNADESGIYLMTLGRDGSILNLQQLSDELKRGPSLFHQAANLYIFAAKETYQNWDTPTLEDTQLVEVFNYDAGFVSLGTTGPDDGLVTPIRVDALSPESALVSWSASTAGNRDMFNLFFARFDAVAQTLTSHDTVVSLADDLEKYRCAVVNVSEGGIVSYLLGTAESTFDPVRPVRVLSVSSDQGETFDETVRLDFMGTINPDDDGAVIDELCPAFEVTDEYIHAVWLNNVYDDASNTRDYKVVNARASLAPPCSRPGW
jgi:hypothetical protein